MRGNSRRIVSMLGIVVLFLLPLCGLGCGKATGGTRALTADYTGDPINDFANAIKVGDLETITRLLDGNPALLELRDEVGQTPMHYAALGNQPKVLQLLVEKGMDPNVRDYEGRTPLTVLEDSGLRHDATRELLIELGGTG